MCTAHAYHEFYGMYYHYYATSFVIIMSWICIVLGLDNACAYVIQNICAVNDFMFCSECMNTLPPEL